MVLYYALKLFLSALIIVVVSEVAKRSSLLGALIASLPLTSILAITWLYIDTKDMEKVTNLSLGIFWIVIPSLLFFVSLPLFLKWGFNFWLGLCGSVLITGIGYAVYALLLAKAGIKI